MKCLTDRLIRPKEIRLDTIRVYVIEAGFLQLFCR